MPVPETVQEALLDAFTVAFNADALSDYDDEGLRVRAEDAAGDLVAVLGGKAATASSLLRAMIADRRHPFFEPLTSATNVGWNASDENFALFQRLAGVVADSIDQESSPAPNERRVVILGPGPGSYEGFERPGLGQEIPEEARAEARRLEAANDIPGLRRLVTRLARDGIEGYDIVVLGQVAGASFDFLGVDVKADGQSALLHSDADWSDRLNEHGLLWRGEDVDEVLAAVGTGEPVPVGRLRRSAILPGDRIWYTVGEEQNPSNPFGRVVLTIEGDGTATLEHHFIGGDGAWTGKVDPELIARIRSELARSPFPDAPREPIPPGTTLRQLEVVTDEEPQYVILSTFQGDRLDGYREAFALLDAIATRLSGGAYRGGADTLAPSAVTDVRPIA